MGIMVYSLLRVMQDFVHQPYPEPCAPKPKTPNPEHPKLEPQGPEPAKPIPLNLKDPNLAVVFRAVRIGGCQLCLGLCDAVLIKTTNPFRKSGLHGSSTIVP